MIKRVFYFLIFFMIFGELLMSAEIKHIEIDGIKVPVVYEEETILPTFNMQLVFKKSGYVNDKDLSGLANLSAKLLDEGTKDLGASKFADELDKRAISIDASTGFETFVISANSLKSEYHNTLKYLGLLLKDPNYSQENLSKIKTLQLGILEREKNNFDIVAKNELMKLVFKGTPLENPEAGNPQSIEKIQLNNIKDFLTNNLNLHKLIIVVGGDIKFEQFANDIKPVLENLSKKEEKTTDEEFKASSKSLSKTIKEDTKQAYVYFASPLEIKANNKNNYLSKIASFILGGSGFGSRLMDTIRVQKGLAYSAYGYFSINKSYSFFTGYLQTKNKNADETISLVKQIVDKFINEGITQKELQSAKDFLTGSEPLRSETLNQRLSRAFSLYYKGLPQAYLQTELKNISNVKLGDINKYIKSHVEIKKLSFAIVRK